MNSKNYLNRRKFLKLTSTATLAAFAPGYVFGKSIPAHCAHCEMDLSSGSLVTRSGKCRNCGADVSTGELPQKISRARGKKKLVEFSKGVDLPFPHPEIQSKTPKACGAMKDVQFNKSKVRKAQIQN